MAMKKLYILSILLLAGCSKSAETIEIAGQEPQGNYITFTMAADSLADASTDSNALSATRAKEFGYWQAGMTLNVYSWLTNTGEKFRDFFLTYHAPYTTSWSYENLIEQPEVSVTYYAYYPENGGVSNFKADGFGGGFDYMVPQYTEDLFISKAISSSARVPMFFFHPLSEINFAVRGVKDYQITLANIRVNNVNNFGHMTMSTWESGSWSGVGGSASYQYTPMAGAEDSDGNPFPTDGLADEMVYLGNHGGWVPSENDRPNALMLMPQSFDIPGAGGFMSFHYVINRMDGTRYKEGDVESYFADFNTNQWLKSKRYLYVIDCRGVIEDPATRTANVQLKLM